MKKKLTFLLAAVVMALALCASAAAAFQVDGLTQGQTGYLAGYDDTGRMVGVRVLSADGAVADIPRAARYKLFRLDGHSIPQGEVLAFTPSEAVVRKIDGQVHLCYGDPEGLGVTVPVTEKVTGKVSSSLTNGMLYIQGKRYSATELTVEGCTLPVSTESFANWDKNGGNFSDTYDFYLDPQGAICWIEQLIEGDHAVCLPLAAAVEENRLLVAVQVSHNLADVLTVTRLDGKAIGNGPDCISLASALAQLQADCEKAFYTYSRRTDGYYHLVRADQDAPVNTGYNWGERYVIPEGSPIQPNADFTFDTIPCRADKNTIFWVAVGAPEEKTYLLYQGFQELPYTQAAGCVIAGSDGVAKYVYLDIFFFIDELPTGYILVADNRYKFDPELYTEGVYQVNIRDTDGSETPMRVPKGLAQAIGADHMELDRFADNTYVGKLFRVTAMDQNATVLGLEQVETYALQHIANGQVTTAAGTWRYNADTDFVYVDLSTDTSSSGTTLVRVSDGGVFDPTSFRPSEIGPGKPYSSVRAAVIPTDGDETLAQYVYIIRTCN